MKIRAHHLACLSRFNKKEKGYNKEFEKNFLKIYKKIKNNPKIKIQLVRKCDDICKKCPHIGKGICKKPCKYKIPHWVKVQDNKILRLIRKKPNSVKEAREILLVTFKRIGNKELKKICRGCEFLDYFIKKADKEITEEKLNKHWKRLIK
jgi:hypothetical protein